MLATLALAASATAQTINTSDWPGFRGADGAGIAAADARPAVIWSDSRNLKWKTVLPGPGSSSPIVWGERVFITCYSGYGDGRVGGSPDKLKRHLICLERKTGDILWDAAVAAELPEDPFRGYLTEHGYASSTPVTDGERVYVFFGKTGALAFDFEGKQLWKVNLGKESSNRRWGSGASPVLYKDLVIVNASEESRSVRALDKRTGREAWKAEAETLELCYSTPMLVEADGRTDLVLSMPGELWGLNPDAGKLRWFADTGIGGNVSPSVVVSEGVIFTTGGYPRIGVAAVRAGGRGDVTQTHVLWTSRSGSYVPSPVVTEGRFYVATDRGYALCLDTNDGEVLFKERLPGASAKGSGKPFYASVVLAKGHLYAVSRSNGTFVFEAKPEFKLVAHNEFTGDDSRFNATPAVAGNQLFLRSNRYLYCIETDAGG